MTLTNPIVYTGDTDGRVTTIRIQKMELGAPDDSGRRRHRARRCDRHFGHGRRQGGGRINE